MATGTESLQIVPIVRHMFTSRGLHRADPTQTTWNYSPKEYVGLWPQEQCPHWGLKARTPDKGRR